MIVAFVGTAIYGLFFALFPCLLCSVDLGGKKKKKN